MSNQQQHPSGFKCPVCSGFIPISMHQLLTEEKFICPQCILEIRLNKGDSQKALDALQKVKDAEDNVKKASVFR